MPHMTDRSCVAAQYADDRNLSIRMKLHAKHSTAQISMNDWLFAQYDLMGPCRILELGCGNAAQWEGSSISFPTVLFWCYRIFQRVWRRSLGKS